MEEARRILVVEDSYLTAESYRTALVAAGFEVVLAADAAAALREAARLPPALAVIDLQLGRGGAEDGLELANALFGRGVPRIVIATGYSPARVDLARLARPAAAVLQKPVFADQLLATVRACLDAPDA